MIKTHQKKRLKTIITLGTINHYADSVLSLIIDKSTKIIHSFQTNNLSEAKTILSSIFKDLTFFPPTHHQHARIISFIYNLKSHLHYRNENYDLAQLLTQQAMSFDKEPSLKKIDVAITYLNKSLIMKVQHKNKVNLFSQQNSITLAMRAMNLIKDSKMMELSHKNDDKIISAQLTFIKELVCRFPPESSDKEMGYLYREAYSLLKDFLGKQHTLTILMKEKLQKNKNIRTKRSTSTPFRRAKTIGIENEDNNHQRLKESIIISTKKVQSSLNNYQLPNHKNSRNKSSLSRLKTWGKDEKEWIAKEIIRKSREKEKKEECRLI